MLDETYSVYVVIIRTDEWYGRGLYFIARVLCTHDLNLYCYLPNTQFLHRNYRLQMQITEEL